MISLYEVIDRAMAGPYCFETDFDMAIFVPKVQEVVTTYKIKYDPENPVPSDDDLADRVFQAGFELYRDVGSYCEDSERIIRFSEEELREALAQAPPATVLGEGKYAPDLSHSFQTWMHVSPGCHVGNGCEHPGLESKQSFPVFRFELHGRRSHDRDVLL